MEQINIDYHYYGMQEEPFTFYRIPKLLTTNERFSCLSNDAILLYGFMLDRMSLSIRNDWFDETNRIYIIYTTENIMRDIKCARNKCAKLLAELSETGLIERKKRGLGKPDIIYVKTLIHSENTYSNQAEQKESEEKNRFENDETVNVQTSYENYKNHTSRGRKNKPQEVGKSYTNNTNINNTDIGIYNLIYPINQEKNEIQLKENSDKSENNLPNTYTKKNEYKQTKFKNNKMDRTQSCQNITEAEKANGYMQIIRENIEYDIYMQDSNNQETFNEIYNLMCDVVIAKCASIRIGGVYYPHELVKARFLKLNAGHVKYVMYAIDNVHEKIHNIRSYMITALYNAPSTIKHYYTNAVSADYGIS